MGCGHSSGVVVPLETSNIEHRIVHLVVTNQTEALLALIRQFSFEVDVNAPLNFRGDTLLHYACAKNNVLLVKQLVSRKDILLTTKNLLKQTPKDLTKNQQIRRLCS